MNDLISRKAVMEELLAIQDVTYMSTCLTVDECKGKRWMIARAIDAVKDAQEVDAVEVVRCKECRWIANPYCPLWKHPTHSYDDYCSYGQRRED